MCFNFSSKRRRERDSSARLLATNETEKSRRGAVHRSRTRTHQLSELGGDWQGEKRKGARAVQCSAVRSERARTQRAAGDMSICGGRGVAVREVALRCSIRCAKAPGRRRTDAKQFA